MSQVRTEHSWAVGAPPAGCRNGAWVPSSHPASPEGRAWLTITQISLPEPRLEWPKPDAVQKSQLPSKEGYQGLGEQKEGCCRDLKVRVRLNWEEGSPGSSAHDSPAGMSPTLSCITCLANRLSSFLPDSCSAYHTIVIPSSPALGSSSLHVPHGCCVHEWACL